MLGAGFLLQVPFSAMWIVDAGCTLSAYSAHSLKYEVKRGTLVEGIGRYSNSGEEEAAFLWGRRRRSWWRQPAHPTVL